jgi:hypothetical protein
MIYMVDIDGTICRSIRADYTTAVPMRDRIEKINRLFEEGHEVHYWTARGGRTGKDWSELTKQQLDEWGCKYTSLKMGKPSYDVWIDDLATNAKDFF